MTWIDYAWPMLGAASLTLGLVHLTTWFQQRWQQENLIFAFAAISVATLSILELKGMHTASPADYGPLVRWGHVPLAILMVALAGFVRVRFQAGRWWLLGLIVSVRLLSLIPNFLAGTSLNFAEITAMRPVDGLGLPDIYAPVGVFNPWIIPAHVSVLMLVIFLFDAMAEVRRRGNREHYRRARAVCLSMIIFLVGAVGGAALVTYGVVNMPFVVNAPFLGVLLVMSYELSGEVTRSTRTAMQLTRSEALLREVEQRSELAVQAAGIAIWSWQLSEGRIELDSKGRVLFGFAEDEPIDLVSFKQRMLAEDRHRMSDVFDEIPKGDLQFERDYRVLLPDGSRRWIATRGRTQLNDEGQAVSVLGVSLDVSRIRLADARFRAAVEASPTAILLVDSGGHIVLGNAQAEILFARPLKDLVGTDVQQLLPQAPALTDATRRGEPPKPVRPGNPETGQGFRALRLDGSTVPVEIRVSPVESADSELVLVSVNDISQRLAAEHESNQQRSELAHLSRVATIGELSASLTHELNQPLTAILANSQAALHFLAGGDRFKQELQDTLTDIAASGKRAGEVIRRLRAMLTKGDPQYRPLDLNLVVTEVVQLYRSEFINREVDVDLVLAPQLPDVLGDRVQLQQVLLNLVINGCDAMMGVSGDRRLTISTEIGSDTQVRLAVRDHGTGIAPEQMERVFEAFVTTKADGMGLGLSVCRTIVDRHGGKLWIESPEDGGARFLMTLQRAAQIADGAVAQAR
jgi:two-component system, LuxR family, sensor kinase FixL